MSITPNSKVNEMDTRNSSYVDDDDRSEPKLFVSSLISQKPQLVHDVVASGDAPPSNSVQGCQDQNTSASKWDESAGNYFTPTTQQIPGIQMKTQATVQSTARLDQEMPTTSGVPRNQIVKGTEKTDLGVQKDIQNSSGNRPPSTTQSLFDAISQGPSQEKQMENDSFFDGTPLTSTPKDLQVSAETRLDCKDTSFSDRVQEANSSDKNKKFKCYERKIFVRVDELREPGQWVDYGKCNGLTDDMLMQDILRNIDGLTVNQYDKDVKNIISRIEGKFQPFYNASSRESACTVYPDIDLEGLGKEGAQNSIAAKEPSVVDVVHQADLLTPFVPKETPQIKSSVQSVLLKPDIQKTTPNTLVSGFGSRSRNVVSSNNVFTTPSSKIMPIPQKSVPVVQSFFEEQWSSPGVAGQTDTAGANKAMDGRGRAAVHPSTLCNAENVASTKNFTGHIEKTVKPQNADKGMGDFESKGEQKSNCSITSSVDDKKTNALFFELVLAEFASLDIAKQKAFKRGVMKLIYDS